MVKEEDVMETVKKAIDTGKKDLDKADTALKFLEAMEVDTKEQRKDFEDAKGRIEKMEKAYALVTGRI